MYQKWANLGKNNHNALSRGLGLGLIRWIERLAQRTKDPQLNTNLGPGQRSTTVARSQVCRGNVGATEGRNGPEGGRPTYNCQRSGHTTNSDLRKQSGMSMQSRWPDGHIPRLADLGKAGRPHLAASRTPASRRRQAHRPYLLTTDATYFTCSKSTLEGYK